MKLKPANGINQSKAVYLKTGRAKTCVFCGRVVNDELYRLDSFSIDKCPACGLVSFRCNRQEIYDFKEMYGEDYYQARKDYFFENPIITNDHERQDENIDNFRHGLSLMEKYARGRRLLDVGCAIGVFLTLAKQSGWKVQGSDISNYAVAYCRNVLKHEACFGDLKDINFPDKSFDVITFWDVIEHFPDPLAQLKQAHRLLADGGVILLDTPNEDSLLRFMARLLYRLSGGRFDYPVRKLYHEFHLHYFTPKTISGVLEKAGFRVLHMEKRSIPVIKARGEKIERMLVKFLSYPEKFLNKEYEILIVAEKKTDKASKNLYVTK